MKLNLKGKSAIYVWYQNSLPLTLDSWDAWYTALMDILLDKTYKKDTYVSFWDSSAKLFIEESWVKHED